MLFVNSSAGDLGEGLAEKVLRSHLGNEACVSWDMLSFKVVCGSSKPVLSLTRVVAILELVVLFILAWFNTVKVALSV